MNGATPGIREVARASGFSLTTVSNALNGKGRVASATRERILAVAAELGYRPHAAALHLARKRSGLLMLTSSPSDPRPIGLMDVEYFLAFAPAASEAAMRAGYAMVLGPSSNRRDLWSDLQLEGALVTDPLPSDPFLVWLEEHGARVVTVGRDIERSDETWWVDSDVQGVTITVLDHLEASGARRIGLVSESPRHSFSIDEQAAYTRWQEGRGGAVLIEETTANHTEAGYHAALRLLDRPDRPDAIVASLEGLAQGVKLAAETRGLTVPGDLMIASTSDGPSLAQPGTSITAVDLAPTRAAELAVGMLVDRLEGRSLQPRAIFAPSQLCVRGSTTA